MVPGLAPPGGDRQAQQSSLLAENSANAGLEEEHRTAFTCGVVSHVRPGHLLCAELMVTGLSGEADLGTQ